MDYTAKDEQLYIEVQRMMAGDFSNYEAFYNLSMNYIYKIIYDIVKDYETTQDLLQETYIRIYNSINQLQDPRAFFAWAGRIATNLTFRHLQKYRLETLAYANEEGELEYFFDRASEDQEAFIPEDILLKDSSRKIIADIIDSLSPEQKITVQYYYFEDMSVGEIAQAMECSTGTVKSRLNYARNAIKNAVLSIEQTQGIRLHSMAAFPILWYVFRESAETFFLSPGATATVGTIGAAGYANTLGSVGAAGYDAMGTIGATGYANTMGEIGAGAVNNAAVGAGSVNNAVVGATGIGTGTSVGAAGVGVSGGTVAGTAGAASATSAGVVAATGLSLGAKIAIAVGGLLAVGGISVGAIHIAQSHKKTIETTTIETTVEATQEAEIVETTEEVTTEEVVEELDEVELYKTYVKEVLIPEYGVTWEGIAYVKSDMISADNPDMVIMEGDLHLGGILSTYIDDLDMDDSEELIILRQAPDENYLNGYKHILDLYELKDDQVVLLDEKELQSYSYYPELDIAQWWNIIMDARGLEDAGIVEHQFSIVENENEKVLWIMSINQGEPGFTVESEVISFADKKISTLSCITQDGPVYWYDDFEEPSIYCITGEGDKTVATEVYEDLIAAHYSNAANYNLNIAIDDQNRDSNAKFGLLKENDTTTILAEVSNNFLSGSIEDYTDFREW